MKKWNILVILVMTILIPYGSSELSVGVDGTIGIDLIPVTPINYSTISTNYSEYSGDSHLFDGYSVSGLYSYYKGLLETYFDGVYCKLTGCTMSGDLTTSGDITANNFIGNGSLLTGINSVLLGTDGQIPFTNSAGDDFDYNDSLTFDGNSLNINGYAKTKDGGIEIEHNPIVILCPEGMSYINKYNGYCIDKYEASVWNANGTWNSESNTSTWNAAADTDAALAAGAYANSSEGKYPWVYIDQTEARTACANYPGGNKYLCTDEQWLGAANIKGQIYNLPLELTDCTVNEGTDCDWADSPGDGDACMTGNKADCVSSEGVYDMVGNVWEWNAEVVDTVKPCNSGSSGYCYPQSDGTWGTSGDSYYGSDGVYFLANNNTGKAVRRGGRWDDGVVAGPFAVALFSGPSSAGTFIGFRCCSEPS